VQSMSESQPTIRINNLDITHYKGIKHLHIEFPSPVMDYDPDILVIGSKNGLGKTSILECAMLLLIFLDEENKQFRIQQRRTHTTVDIPDLLIHGGEEEAVISGEIEQSERSDKEKDKTGFKTVIIKLSIHIRRDGTISVSRTPTLLSVRENLCTNSGRGYAYDQRDNIPDDFYRFLQIISGFDQNPLISEMYLFFHSYRKVMEGNPELGQMISDDSLGMIRPLKQSSKMSSFKLTILRMMMSQADLFESGTAISNENDAFSVLNNLMEIYAGGKISKLRPSKDNTIDIRIKPLTDEESYSFDGLSSGQKEMISTLFMIWNTTWKNPAVVFIDEPELHLNTGWHRNFVHKLLELVPDNQYIISTHSEDVMASVKKDNRLLILEQDLN